MSRSLNVGSLLGFFLLAATGADAQSECTLDGQKYPENTLVCSGGLVNYCANGTWQSSGGARCDAPTGAYLGARRPFEERNTEEVPQFYKDKYPDLKLP